MGDLVPIMKSDIDNVPIKYNTNIHTYGKDQAHLHDYTLKKGHVEKSLDVKSDSPWIDVMECSSLSMMANESNVGNLQDSLLPPKGPPIPPIHDPMGASASLPSPSPDRSTHIHPPLPLENPGFTPVL
uniref:Uncharacterized protein n=1 Tax=Timema douglasi TaxID=61478 RepID=A0A7R8VKA4_TIMDO|nr:unnamed protein product [Timema douglasi]